MREQTIYEQLRRAGMSAAGACGMMANMKAESAMRANNVQDGYGYTDEQYTAGVDAGIIDFLDGIGYGLCQWTYGPRKRNMLAFHRQRGVSIGDEATQVAFCLHELQSEYTKLWAFLCTTNGVYDAAARICREYERPAVNNIAERAGYANEYFMRFGGMEIGGETPPVSSADSPLGEGAKGAEWPPRELEYGMFGGDVIALQGLLFARGYHIKIDGDFGNATKNAVAGFQAEAFGYGDGRADYRTWDALLERGGAP